MAVAPEVVISYISDEIGHVQEILNMLSDIEKKKVVEHRFGFAGLYIKAEPHNGYAYTYKKFVLEYGHVGEDPGKCLNYSNIWDLAHDLKKYRNQLQQEYGWFIRYSCLGDPINAKAWLMSMRTDNSTVAKCLHHARDIEHARKYVHPSVRTELNNVLTEIREEEERARKNKSKDVQEHRGNPKG